ncbi:response regulator [Amantichitinum ursilacus]|uniref:Polar-differentiation response regulator DivK n=1 Tax=Amantichitinum ursilacus TaxID=857265 RepID=A0A0N1JTV4_9NEIS|nr:response regulator [Amantichitinum ursilacus]KPC55186.1 Polar-differentiation response regulator DivK [Amantichitinum ursilacus]
MFEAQSQMTQPTAKVLIVDDDEFSRKLLNILISAEQYATFECSSAEAALALMPAMQPDLILVDLMMPGMDGFELTARIRQITALQQTPVVIMSALDDMAVHQRIEVCGADAFVHKPINRWELLDTVNRFLRPVPLSDQVGG